MRLSLSFSALVLAAPWIGPAAGLAGNYAQDALCYTGQDEVCPFLPVDLTGLKVTALDYIPGTDAHDESGANQQNFDYFAWQMFVALNWPAKDGVATGSILDTSTDNMPRVWESWPGIDEVYGSSSPVPTSCGAGRLTLNETNKVTSSSFIEPFTPYPLIDEAGNFAMYDIRMNAVEAAYIMKNGLNTQAGQSAFNKDWDLPRGAVTSGQFDDVAAAVPGAMEMKTTWRILPDGDDGFGYFTVPGSVYVAAKDTVDNQELCLDVELGLVAMHLMQKISTPATFSDYWVWGTFEHKRNAPVAQGATVSQRNNSSTADIADLLPLDSCPVPGGDGNPYAFFNPGCMNGDAACGPNDPPDIASTGHVVKWQSTPPYGDLYRTADSKGNRFGTQVTRCWDIYDSARSVTEKFQTALDGTVWANYELIGAQWAQQNEQSAGPPGVISPYPAPVYLVNSTLETYLQLDPVTVKGSDGTYHKNTSGPSGSCIICHDMAKDTAGNKSDFSFLAGYAR